MWHNFDERVCDKPQQEGGRVRSEDGRVDDEEQDDPVPHGFEGAVMEDGPFLDPGRL